MRQFQFSIVLYFAFFCSAVFSQTYTVTDLGTLPNGVTSGASAINALGQATGNSDMGFSTPLHAFLWSGSLGMRDLGTLAAGQSSLGYGINSHAVVAGGSTLLVNSQVVEHAFVWTKTKGMQDLGYASRRQQQSRHRNQ